MTLLDAPVFDEARERRHRVMFYSGAGLLLVLFIGAWLVSGRPVDWPWNWWGHFRGRMTVNHFLDSVEKNDLEKAYGIWIHNSEWQKHPNVNGAYPFTRFVQDWSSSSPDNEYGAIKTHKIVAARMYGNVLLMAVLINGRKSGALDLDYDPNTHTLTFSPPGVELYLGP
jgi:hypothetical protein